MHIVLALPNKNNYIFTLSNVFKWEHMTHHVYLAHIQWCPGSSYSSTDLHHRDATHQQLFNTRPLSRMQLWIFTPQRDNEVNSRAKNEPVVLWRGSWGLSWQCERFVEPNISEDIPITDRILLSTTLTCASRSYTSLEVY